MNALRIEVWSDIACPWCWVGKRRLEAAIGRFDPEVEVVWRSFELDPSAPKAHPPGTDFVQRLADKYQTTAAQARAMIDRMTQVGADDGIEFRFDRIAPGNTFDAHRLLHWARAHAAAAGQGALKERLFAAYLHEGRSMSDHEVLVDVAEAAGLDPDRAQAVLSSDAYARDVREDESTAARLGATGVPLFVIGGRYGIGGAQPADAMLGVMRRAWSEAQLGEESTPAVEPSDPSAPADGCGPDGCAIGTTG